MVQIMACCLIGRDKRAAMFQTTFLNAFSWVKMYQFRLRFHWNLFQRFKLTMFQHWFKWWLGADQATSHYLNQWWLVYWCTYVSLGLNELTKGLLVGLIYCNFSIVKKTHIIYNILLVPYLGIIYIHIYIYIYTFNYKQCNEVPSP